MAEFEDKIEDTTYEEVVVEEKKDFNPFEAYTAPKSVEYKEEEFVEKKTITEEKQKENKANLSIFSGVIVDAFDGIMSNVLAYIAKEPNSDTFSLKKEDKAELKNALSEVIKEKAIDITPEMYLIIVLFLVYVEPTRKAIQLKSARSKREKQNNFGPSQDDIIEEEITRETKKSQGGRPSGSKNKSL